MVAEEVIVEEVEKVREGAVCGQLVFQLGHAMSNQWCGGQDWD